MYDNLYQYIDAHVERVTEADEHTVDMVFFKLKPAGAPQAADLKAHIAKHEGHYGAVDLFDGKEHSYLEIGGWIGDQGYALTLMGLGTALGLWDLLTPINMLGLTPEDPMAQQMAGLGYVSIKANPNRVLH